MKIMVHLEGDEKVNTLTLTNALLEFICEHNKHNANNFTPTHNPFILAKDVADIINILVKSENELLGECFKVGD